MLQHKYHYQPTPDEEEDPFFDLPRLVDLEEIDDKILVLMVEVEIAIVSRYCVNLTALKLSDSSVCRNLRLVTKTSLDNTFITAWHHMPCNNSRVVYTSRPFKITLFLMTQRYSYQSRIRFRTHVGSLRTSFRHR